MVTYWNIFKIVSLNHFSSTLPTKKWASLATGAVAPCWPPAELSSIVWAPYGPVAQRPCRYFRRWGQTPPYSTVYSFWPSHRPHRRKPSSSRSGRTCCPQSACPLTHLRTYISSYLLIDFLQPESQAIKTLSIRDVIDNHDSMRPPLWYHLYL